MSYRWLRFYPTTRIRTGCLGPVQSACLLHSVLIASVKGKEKDGCMMSQHDLYANSSRVCRLLPKGNLYVLPGLQRKEQSVRHKAHSFCCRPVRTPQWSYSRPCTLVSGDCRGRQYKSATCDMHITCNWHVTHVTHKWQAYIRHSSDKRTVCD